MPDPAPSPNVRPLIPLMRWLLYAASLLVFLAGLQLTVFSEQTATYFAWTINPPITAAFLGAAYWAAVPAIWLFTTLTLVVTLVHVDRFHFSSPVPSAQGAAWFWLAIYAGVPVAMLLIGWWQVRAPGGDPPRGPSPPAWMRIVVLVQGGGMLAWGTALLLAPAVAGPVWPWGLTPLTARAIGAWFVALEFAALHAIRENDFARIRPLEGGYAAFAVLQFVAIARYSGEVTWSSPAAWIYLAFLASVLVIALFPLIYRRFKEPERRGRATN